MNPDYVSIPNDTSNSIHVYMRETAGKFATAVQKILLAAEHKM